MLSLSRKKIYLLGLVAMLALVFTSRIDFMIGSSYTQGKVVEFYSWRTPGLHGGSFFQPVVSFKNESFMYEFRGETNDKYELGEKVKVIYKKDDPTNARIFSFIGFVLAPLLWCILPLILWTSAIYSFLNRDFKLKIPLFFWKKKSTNTE